MPKMYKKSTIWSGFEIENWIEDQFQSSPQLVRIWTVLRCTFVPNLQIVTSIGGELWHGQAQNGVNFDFGVQFVLEGHNQSSHKTIGILTKVFYISGPNLVVLAETGDELLRGQARDWHTGGHTGRQTQATIIPEGQNWPQVTSYSLATHCGSSHFIAALTLTRVILLQHLKAFCLQIFAFPYLNHTIICLFDNH